LGESEPEHSAPVDVSDRIDQIDLSATLSHDESEKRIRAAHRRLAQLRLFTAGLIEPHEVGPGLLVLFEGFDAAGKGGAIQRLVSGLDPRHVRVVPIGPPDADDLRHHFLWRFSPTLPGRGQMTVYDRSWYGRALVERVEHLIDHKEALHSLGEIVEFERSLIHEGTTIVKFWLHVSDEEQLRRFRDREKDPLKRWKLTPDDWHNRERRPAYLKALAEMIEISDQPHAHWDLISGEDKHYARVAVLETLIARWEHDLARRGVAVPEAHGDDYLK
jgi:AMP-polyphosphate phosphotransferase